MTVLCLFFFIFLVNCLILNFIVGAFFVSNLVRDIIIDIVFNDRNLVVMIDLLIRALSMRLIIVDDMLFNYRFRRRML